MADTIRETIISALVTKLGEIRTANGYNSDCGQDVRRAAFYFRGDELPAISFFAMPETAEQEYGANVCTMPVQVRAIFEHGSSSPSVIGEQVLGDLIQCLTGLDGAGDPRKYAVTGNAKDSLFYRGGGIEDYPQSDDKATLVVANFDVIYRTKATNPYERPA